MGHGARHGHTSSLAIVCLVGVSVLTREECLAAFEDPETVITEKCAADWPHNSRMRAACMEQQGQILDKSLKAPIDPRLAIEDLTLIREKCAQEWPDDFRQRVQCERQQIRGFQKLQSPPPRGITLTDYSLALAYCAKEWPDDFRLRARCLEEQLAERRRQHDVPETNEPR